MVASVAADLKMKYETELLERAAEARQNADESPASMQKIDQGVLRQIENTVSDLRRAEYNTFGRHVKKLSRILHSDDLDPVTCKLAETVNLDAWLEAGERTQGGMIGSAELEWPSSEEEELGLVVQLIDRFSEKPDEAMQFAHTFYYNGSNVTDNLQNMVAQMIVPFGRDYINYVKSSTGTPEATLLPISSRAGPAARKIFIVHGHDEGAREAVARFLEKLNFEPIILHE